MPLQIALTRRTKQINAALVDVIELQHARFDARHDREQAALALEQRQAAKVPAIQREQIERVKGEWGSRWHYAGRTCQKPLWSY